MAFVTADRVKETTKSTGTGDLALNGATKGFQAFGDAMSDGDTCPYAIVDRASGDYETGIATYNSGADSLTRDTVKTSSNSGPKVDFGAGVKTVGISPVADRLPVGASDPSDGELLRYNGTQWEHLADTDHGKLHKVVESTVNAGHPDFTGANNAEKVDAAIQFADGLSGDHVVVVPESRLPYDVSAMPNGHLNSVPVIREGQGSDFLAQLPPVFDQRGAVSDASQLDGPHDVQVEDGYAYVAGKDGSFGIVDLSDPDGLEVVGSITSGVPNCQTVEPQGSYCILGTDDGIEVADVSDPTNPTIIGSVAGNTRINGLAVYKHWVFAADKSGSVGLFNLLDPRNPTRSGGTSISGINSPHDIDYFSGHIIVPNQNDGDTDKVAVMEVVDEANGEVKDPVNWTLQSKLQGSNKNGANRVIVRGRYAYMASNLADTVSVIDVSDPDAISEVANISLSSAEPNGITLMADWLVAAASGNLEVLDIRNPDDPQVVLTAGGNGADHDLEMWGRFLVTTSQANNRITVFEATGITIPGINAGGIRTDVLNVEDYARVKDLEVTSTLRLRGESPITLDPIRLDRQQGNFGVGPRDPTLLMDLYRPSSNAFTQVETGLTDGIAGFTFRNPAVAYSLQARGGAGTLGQNDFVLRRDGTNRMAVSTSGEGYFQSGLEWGGGAQLDNSDIVLATAQTYTPTNDTTVRSFDANNTTVAELADVLATLLRDTGRV